MKIEYVNTQNEKVVIENNQIIKTDKIYMFPVGLHITRKIKENLFKNDFKIKVF